MEDLHLKIDFACEIETIHISNTVFKCEIRYEIFVRMAQRPVQTWVMNRCCYSNNEVPWLNSNVPTAAMVLSVPFSWSNRREQSRYFINDEKFCFHFHVPLSPCSLPAVFFRSLLSPFSRLP